MESYPAPPDSRVTRNEVHRIAFTALGLEHSQASVSRPVPYVEWFVNGKLYQRTGPPYQVYWPLERGRFQLTAVTPENIGDSVRVTVE